MVFRESTKRDYLKTFDDSMLGRHAFEIDFPSEGSSSGMKGSHFNANYIGKENFFFRITEKYDSDIKKWGYEMTYAPGVKLLDKETIFSIEFENCKGSLKYWLDRLFEELKDKSPLINKVYEEISRIEDEFEQKLNEKFTSSDNTSFFTKEEIHDLKSKIDSLILNFQKLKDENDLKDSELKAIKQELEKIKATLQVLPKATWYKSSGKKIINLIGKYLNPDMVKALATEAVKGLLNDK